MATEFTDFANLEKPEQTDYYDVEIFNNNAEKIDTLLEQNDIAIKFAQADIDTTQATIGQPSGLATLDADGELNLTQLPDKIPHQHSLQDSTLMSGICTSAGSAASKVVNCSDFELVPNAKIVINFANANTATAVTLNVNNTGAVPLVFPYGDAAFLQAKTHLFTYNATDDRFYIVHSMPPRVTVTEAAAGTTAFPRTWTPALMAGGVRATTLNGLDIVNEGDIEPTDTVLNAFGKLQGQIDTIESEFPDDVRSTTLEGINVSQAADIDAADTVLSALGKLQGQIDSADSKEQAHEDRRDNPHVVRADQLNLSHVNDTSDMDKPVSNAQATAIANAVQTMGDTKVDKITGSRLMTTAEGAKLAGIETGAEKNVNVDWFATSGKAQILNQPTLGTAAAKNTGNAVGQIPIVNAQGKLDLQVIPPQAITDVEVFTDKPSLLGWNTHVGSVGIITDGVDQGTYILSADPSSDWVNWVPLVMPAANVESINGLTGAVVLTISGLGGLAPSDIVNSLTSTEVDLPLSANQGNVLKVALDSAILNLSILAGAFDSLNEYVGYESIIDTGGSLSSYVLDIIGQAAQNADYQQHNLYFSVVNGELRFSIDGKQTWLEGGAGPVGPQGRGYRPQGNWVSGQVYVYNSNFIDTVFYDGSTYACIATTDAAAVTPPSEDTAHWLEMATGITYNELDKNVVYTDSGTGTNNATRSVTIPGITSYSQLANTTIKLLSSVFSGASNTPWTMNVNGLGPLPMLWPLTNRLDAQPGQDRGSLLFLGQSYSVTCDGTRFIVDDLYPGAAQTGGWKGIVSLSSDTNSTSENIAATLKAVKTLNDRKQDGTIYTDVADASSMNRSIQIPNVTDYFQLVDKIINIKSSVETSIIDGSTDLTLSINNMAPLQVIQEVLYGNNGDGAGDIFYGGSLALPMNSIYQVYLDPSAEYFYLKQVVPNLANDIIPGLVLFTYGAVDYANVFSPVSQPQLLDKLDEVLMPINDNIDLLLNSVVPLIEEHVADTDNPHAVTAEQTGALYSTNNYSGIAYRNSGTSGAMSFQRPYEFVLAGPGLTSSGAGGSQTQVTLSRYGAPVVPAGSANRILGLNDMGKCIHQSSGSNLIISLPAPSAFPGYEMEYYLNSSGTATFSSSYPIQSPTGTVLRKLYGSAFIKSLYPEINAWALSGDVEA